MGQKARGLKRATPWGSEARTASAGMPDMSGRPGMRGMPGLPGLPALPTLPALLVCEVLQLSKPSLSENFFFASELLNGSFRILAKWPTGW